MTQNVLEAVNKARELFSIKDFPGNLFSLLENQNYIERFNLLLFKEDISKLSGFVGYGENGISVICINYKRPIGHQNFTLAHELGHWFLHKGQNISDNDNSIWSKDKREQEANMFAAELLYPEMFFVKDYFEAIKNGFLQVDKRKELAVYNDKGRVILHPDQNLFDLYAEDSDIMMLTGEDWIEEIGYVGNDLDNY